MLENIIIGTCNSRCNKVCIVPERKKKKEVCFVGGIGAFVCVCAGYLVGTELLSGNLGSPQVGISLRQSQRQTSDRVSCMET